VRLTGAGAPPATAAERRLALIVLIGAAVVLGVAPILVRLGEVGPAAAGFWRGVFALPVLLVLHVSDTFGPAIASWLKAVSNRRVRLADGLL
jgi:hypothetical protein